MRILFTLWNELLEPLTSIYLYRIAVSYYERISASFWPDSKTDLLPSSFQVTQIFNFKSLSPLRLLQAFFYSFIYYVALLQKSIVLSHQWGRSSVGIVVVEKLDSWHGLGRSRPSPHSSFTNQGRRQCGGGGDIDGSSNAATRRSAGGGGGSTCGENASIGTALQSLDPLSTIMIVFCLLAY